MRKKIFAVSDIHGHATVLKSELKKAGFVPNSSERVLIVCGDCFDRGTENLEVLSFLQSVNNKLLIRGNHEDILSGILKRGCTIGADRRNGTDATVKEFFGDAYDVCSGSLNISPESERYCEVQEFLCSMLDYYETENYVFTHGWLPNDYSEEEHMSVLLKDWKNASSREWWNARWTEWPSMYAVGALLPDKTIVCGHRSADMALMFDPTRKENDNSIFYGDGMIAIDSKTIRSGRINVLVLEDEICE